MPELTWLYAFGLQAAAVVALVYVVTLLGARIVAPPYPGTPPRRGDKQP